jgi:DNA-binding SARP family transcriptional activator
MNKARLRSYVDALVLVFCEVVLFEFFLRAGPLLGSVDFSHLSRWLNQTGPEAALTALFRLLGIVVSGWLCLSTAVYGCALLTGKGVLLSGTSLITLPVLRRVLDTAAAATIVAASFGAGAGNASAAPVPPRTAVVRPLLPPKPVEHPSRRPPNPITATVSSIAIGRHFPHPGVISHVLPNTPLLGGVRSVPSQANGFAGLAPGTKVVVVQPGDCLSVIAERHLGDWRLDTEIEALNWGRPQPDGRALVDDHWIYPGWVLVMPAGATGTLVVGGHSAYASHAHHAAPHHSLPQGKAGPTRPPSMEGGGPPSPKPARGGAPAVRGALARADAREVAARQVAARQVAAHEVAAAISRQGAAATSEQSAIVTTRHHGDPALAAALGMGAVAAAGLIWRLDRARRTHLHARQRGAPVLRNRPEVEAAERRARAIADQEVMRWVDLGLRYLSGLVEEASGRAPSVVMITAGSSGLEVTVSPPPSEALGWFFPSAAGESLVLDPEVDLEELEALSEEHWPAWPALVSLGEAEEGTVLLNLEHAGSLSVEGDPEAVEQFLGNVVLQLSCQPWADEMLAGLYVLGDCPLDDRLAQVEKVGDDRAGALDDRLRAVSSAHQDLVGDGDLATLRAAACEALPNVVVAFAGAPDPVVRSLVGAAKPRKSGVVVICNGSCTEAGWRLTLSGEGQGLLQGEIGARSVSLALKLDCDRKEVVLLSEAMGAADERAASRDYGRGDGSGGTGDGSAEGEGFGPRDVVDIRESGYGHGRPEVGEAQPKSPAGSSSGPSPAGSSRGPSPAGPSRGAAPEGAGRGLSPVGTLPNGVPQGGDGAHVGAGGSESLAERGVVEISIMGPVDLLGGDMDALEPARRTPALAAIAYLAVKGRPVSADELGSALWPLDVKRDGLGGPQRKTIMNVLSRARNLLGYGPRGRDRLHHTAQGYVLADDVSCDWARFSQLVNAASRQEQSEAMATLHRALELSRGEPFAGSLSSQFFEWVSSEHLDLMISAQAVDAAQGLGQLALEVGDHAEAIWAVDKGLQLDPAREELFRIKMHALGRSGRRGDVDNVYRRLRVVIRRRFGELYEPAPESRGTWRLYTAAEMAEA